MKILASKQPVTRDVLRIPSGFATLISIKRQADGTETYLYSTYVDVDIVDVIEDSVTHVEMELYPDEFFINAQKQQLSTDGLSSANFIEQIQTMQTDKKQQFEAIAKSLLYKTKFEILPHLDPTLYTRVRNATTRSEKLELLPLRKVVQQRTIQTNNTSGAAPLTASPNPLSANRSSSTGQLRLASIEFLLRHGDVGKYIESQTKAGSAELAFAGVNQIKNKRRSKRVVNQRDTARVMNDVENSVNNALQGTPDTHALVTTYVRETTKRIRHTFEISSVTLGSTKSLRVQCNVYGKKRGFKIPTILQTTTSTFSHVDAVSEYNAPRIAPTVLNATSVDMGKNAIEIMQNDQSAVAINIYRRILDKTNNFNDPAVMRWQFVETVPLTKGNSIKYIDRVSNEKSITYRAVAVGDQGQLAANYDAAIVQGRSKTTRAAALSTAAFYVIQTGDNARIVLTNTQVDAVAYSFKKRNVTIKQTQFVDVGERSERLLINSNGVTELIDYDVRPDSTYEYICIIHGKNGTSRIANVNQVYQHKQVDNNTLSLVIGQSGLTDEGGETDVTFTLTTSLKPTKLDDIKALLERQGLYDIFKQQVVNEKDQLTNLLCHHVRRYDNSTGELVSFGIVTDDTFSDRKYGRRYGITPPLPGRTYTYIATTVLRDVETVFENYDKIVSSTQRITGNAANSSNLTTQQYNARPAKFKHPLSLRLGTLTSELSRKQNYGLDELLYGEVGNDVITTIDTPTEGFNVEDLSVQIADDDTNTVSWSLTGDSTTVDYYVLSVADDKNNILEHIALHQFDGGGAQVYRHDVRKLKNTPLRYVLTTVSTLQSINKTLIQIGPKR